MSATVSTELKRCVINQFTGSQPQRMESNTSGMLVKVDSTSTPLSSLTELARSIATAPPSEWPKI